MDIITSFLFVFGTVFLYFLIILTFALCMVSSHADKTIDMIDSHAFSNGQERRLTNDK